MIMLSDSMVNFIKRGTGYDLLYKLLRDPFTFGSLWLIINCSFDCFQELIGL